MLFYYLTSVFIATALGVPSPSSQIRSVVSPDGTCGGTTGFTCTGSASGGCCSGFGFCGSSLTFCDLNQGCQAGAGKCINSTLSSDGTCGSAKGYTCSNSAFGTTSYGACCSSSGWCGSDYQFCGQGCQSGYGNCDTVRIPTTTGECGPNRGNYTCDAGPWIGDCCSADGFCGKSNHKGSADPYCGNGCIWGYGACNSGA